MKFNWVRFDGWLLGCVIILCFVGLLTLHSALLAIDTFQGKLFFKKQLIWCFIGFLAMLCCLSVEYNKLRKLAYMIYVLSIVLLIFVLLFGKSAGGARRWLSFRLFSIQPSEMVKVSVIIVLSNIYAEAVKMDGLNVKDLLKPFIVTVVPFLLVIQQPDLGTAMVILLVFITLTAFVRFNRKALIFAISSFLIIIPLLWFFLRSYQKNRIMIFFNPDNDPLGAGYHIIQSKIAIGSGKLFGKGFMNGTQNVLSFLPEKHTDFIFSVLAEEWGFLGTVIVLILFGIVMVRGLIIAGRCRKPFGTILAFGITSIIAWHVFINIGMVTGLLPVVGVSLPFMSYGGSSFLTTMTCIGLLLNISSKVNCI